MVVSGEVWGVVVIGVVGEFGVCCGVVVVVVEVIFVGVEAALP